jgi:hypothetical protein
MKQIVRLKKVVNLAIKNEWLDNNPFVNYHVKMKETNRGFLTPKELHIIETKELPVHRIQKVRDIFIFENRVDGLYSSKPFLRGN